MSRRAPGVNEFARSQRSNPTVAEDRLWQHLRRRQLSGHRFRRQHPIGPYFADFACLQQRLVVEVDGSQHIEDPERDRRRDQFLSEQGYRTLRFTNDKVLQDLDSVLEAIAQALDP